MHCGSLATLPGSLICGVAIEPIVELRASNRAQHIVDSAYRLLYYADGVSFLEPLMTKITYIDTTGMRHVVDAKPDTTVMQTGKQYGVPGILADCGGACACATCHVIVDAAWVSRIPPAAEVELQMLEFALNREDNSRLSCQIKVEPSLDGLVVRVASSE